MTPLTIDRAAPTATRLPLISVIVPVRNEERFIAATLSQLFAQDYPADRFEVIVADGGSTDDTRGIVRRLAERRPNLRLLPNPRRWSSAGRNVAARAARGDVVLLIDGHCEIDNPRYFADLADAFATSGADCVGRPQPLDVTGASTLQRAIAAARSSRLGHHPASHIYSGREGFVPPDSVAVAYRREVFDRVGWFDEGFDACEDVEFNHRLARANLTCWFTPRVAVRYHPRDTLPGLFRQMERYGRGRVRLLRKHRDTFSLPGFLPGAFVAGLLAGPALASLFSVLWFVYFGAVAAYGVIVLAFSLALAVRHREPLFAVWCPLVFAAVHVGAGWGLLREAFVGLHPRNERGAAGLVPAVRTAGTSPAALPLSPPQRKTLNALTIDVEDYFHVSAFDGVLDRTDWDALEPRVGESTERLLDVLASANVRATFFILGWVAERQPSLVRAVRAAGHEVGCHSYAHRLIYRQTPDEFRADLRRGLDALEDAIGERVTLYRAPSFSITKDSLWAIDVLIEEGIRIDSSVYPTHHDRYGIPGTPLGPHRIDRRAGQLWEFPPPVWRCLGYPLPVGGGGYFRLYPYALTRSALSKINAAGRPFAAYLHPWELDPEQPRVPAGAAKRFRHYVNLRQTEPRLARLLADFQFGTLSEALAAHEPSSQPTPQRRAA
jgi:succinoglycan biosynthesis protein ExoA